MQSPATDKNIKLKIVTNPPDPKSFVFMFESSRALAEREAIKSFVSESMARARQLAGDKTATPASVATLTNDSPASSVASTPAPSTPTTTLTPSNAATPAVLSPNLNISRQEEIANRRQLLSTNKELHTLHSELVINGKNVTEEEFWESPYVQKIRQVSPFICISILFCYIRTDVHHYICICIAANEKRCSVERGSTERKIFKNGRIETGPTRRK
jgi:hypothetical protein